MREGIHPNWFPEAKVTCLACGKTWTTGSTRPTISLDVCANCHPFYTGEQRIVDTEGQVDRFMKRLEGRGARPAEAPAAVKGQSDLALSELGLGKQYTELLEKNGISKASDVIRKLEEGGDEAILEIRGIGRRVLTDIKKGLRARGYQLPVAQEA